MKIDRYNIEFNTVRLIDEIITDYRQYQPDNAEADAQEMKYTLGQIEGIIYLAGELKKVIES